MALFNRIVSVSLKSGFSSDELFISFNVQKTAKEQSNTATVTIANLSANTRNSIKEIDDVLTLSAGYQEDTGAKVIFVGDVVRIKHNINPPDIITEIECGDGVKTLRETRGSVSFKDGTPADNVLKDLTGKLGLPLREIPEGLSDQYVQGFSHAGSVRDAINKVTDRLGLEWSVQNEEIQIIKKNEPSKGSPIDISFATGLLEFPEKLDNLRDNLVDVQPPPGIRIKTLLNPDYVPGRKVFLKEGEFPGIYRIERVTHSGDNKDGEFISELEASQV